MARIDNLSDFLTDVASSIKNKTGKTDAIPAANFDTEINSIVTGTVMEKAVIEANAIIEETTVVKIDSAPIEEPIVIPENGVAEVIADKAVLAENIGLTADKIVKGEEILGIQGNAEGGTTIESPTMAFESIEEMNAYTGAKEDDLAIIYSSSVQNANADSVFSSAIFPATVVLPQAVTSSINVAYVSTDSSIRFDCWGSLSATRFSMSCYTDSGSISIAYTSSDGITYARTDSGDETIDFGTEIQFDSRYDEFNDLIGYFIQIDGSTFDGLYQFKNVKDDNYGYRFNIVNDMINATESLQSKYAIKMVDTDKMSGQNIFARLVPGDIVSGIQIYNIVEMYYMSGWGRDLDIVHNGDRYYICASKYSSNNDLKLVHFSNNTTTEIELNDPSEIMTICEIDINEWYYTSHYILDGGTDGAAYFRIFATDGTTEKTTKTITPAPVVYPHYIPASTQFTLNDPSQLLPGKVAFGSKGPVTGDGSIYDELDVSAINDDILKVNLFNTSSGDSTASIRGNVPSEKQNMISYSADKNGTNFVYYSDKTTVTPNFEYTAKCDEDTLIGIKYNSSTKTLTAYKYVYSANALTELCSITNTKLSSSINNHYDMIAIDNAKQNVYLAMRYYYSSNYYLDCYKIDLVNKTFTTVCTHSNSSSNKLNYSTGAILSLEQQAVFMDTQSGIMKYPFSGSASTLVSKSSSVANYYSRWNVWRSSRYLQVVRSSSTGIELYDTKTNKFIASMAHASSNDVDFALELNGTTYIYRPTNSTLYTLDNGTVTSTRVVPNTNNKSISSFFPGNAPFVYDDTKIVCLMNYNTYLFDLDTLEFEELDTLISGGAFKILKKDNKDTIVHHGNYGTTYYVHVTVDLENNGEFLAFLIGDKTYGSYKMRTYEYNYLAENKCLPSIQQSVSPAEYDEINDMAEDILGGVE